MPTTDPPSVADQCGPESPAEIYTINRNLGALLASHQCDVRWCEKPAVVFDGVHHLCLEHDDGCPNDD